jgi:RNA polymerase sigma-70 factor (ECF subfamily)
VDELTRAAVAAGAGDRLALGEFVRRGQAEVWRLCANLVDREAADDLTQDTFLRAVQALPAFRAEASARTWLLSIARRACADEIRRRGRRRRLLARVASGRADSESPGPSGAVELDLLVATLEPGRRAAFVLTQLLGLSYAEAAEVCDCPVGTVRSRVARARGDLVTALAGPAAGDSEEAAGS